jgi:hypothetical protein
MVTNNVFSGLAGDYMFLTNSNGWRIKLLTIAAVTNITAQLVLLQT